MTDAARYLGLVLTVARNRSNPIPNLRSGDGNMYLPVYEWKQLADALQEAINVLNRRDARHEIWLLSRDPTPKALVEAALREIERGVDVRRNRTTIMGNVHMILTQAFAAFGNEATEDSGRAGRG